MSVKLILENHSERLDKWLWMARFFKTRSLATDFVNSTAVWVNQQKAKPSKDIKINDVIYFEKQGLPFQVTVLAFSNTRGNASIAQVMYAEDETIAHKRQEKQALNKLMREPARDIKGRPSKKDRRQIDSFTRD
jgi:ribosome-associated heat shock protein Hsp15